VIHERALSPVELFGGKTPAGAIGDSGPKWLARTFFGASVTTVCLFFFVIGRVLTRLSRSGYR